MQRQNGHRHPFGHLLGEAGLQHAHHPNVGRNRREVELVDTRPKGDEQRQVGVGGEMISRAGPGNHNCHCRRVGCMAFIK